MWKRRYSSPLSWVLTVVVVAGVLFGGYWFQPWKLVTDNVVDESVPVIQQTATDDPSPGTSPSVSPSPAGNQLLASGQFISHEYETTGTAQVIQLGDGRRQLVLRDFATSNGPDLRVWLSDQPVLEGRAGWHVFDDGQWAELDRLKGNQGNQVYDIPDDVDLAKLTSVSIWCKRFSVSFGAADLTA
ncbi:hypothetical protein E0H26_13285 [Micromonospora zingiberis]|uniref:DM13 domain-containing protein n=1 Tax=Micromonospora zingiberis TaxID=2053011 RepID=A0A4R0GP33_9ACTN|nr:DM13 domain-containing protein [Micromonospora zingiberis]TCB97238.1 hypothetical protein E0H26_13285 [Micromonospora zingiberis]